MAKYKSVRSFRRGLDVLRALNLKDGARVQELSQMTEIHRATVYRLLETLREANFVQNGSAGDTYRLTPNVRQLSDGFTDESSVASVAGPVLRDLQREVGWPTNFAVFHVDSMVVRETTHHLSPFSCHRILAGIVLPVLHTAIGQAYFSFCSEDERAQILRVLQSSKVADSTLAANDPYIAEMVRTTRARGYSVSPGLFKPRRQLEARSVSAIAVPVFMHGRVAGAVNIVFFAKAISATSAAEKYLPLLRRAAKLIEARSTALSELSWDGVAAQPMLAVHPAGAAMAPHGPDRLAVPPGEGGALLPRSLQASAVATRCPPAR